MSASISFQRSVKIQYHRDQSSGRGRAKVAIPARIRREAGVEAGSFMEWAEQTEKLVARPALEEGMDTTRIEVRKSGTQAEIPKFLCNSYDLFGKSCAWTLQQGVMSGTIKALPQKI